jgi:crotonobetainyl-CoA:carnitine CoA-transferase CaiB-like acyl-CoA transferase
MTTRAAPLAGKRILDLSRVLAGPWCTMILGDLGAEVIKVENPKGGDDTRGWGPPYAAGESAYYLCANRNKKSVVIDLSCQAGQVAVKALAATSDVLVENYKLGGLDKYGLDYPSLSAQFPGLIYCSISGYGRQSPRAAEPGYDYVIQAEGGLMAINGDVDRPPVRVGVAVADLFTGMFAAQAILAALIAKDRDGLGQHIDMALFDSQLAMLANVGSSCLVSDEEPKRFGNSHPSVVPYQTFETADGRIVIAVGNDHQFGILCRDLLGRADLASDARFVTNAARVQHRGELIPLLESLIVTHPSEWWIAALKTAKVPCGEVRPMKEALSAAETLARGMVQSVSHPLAGTVPLIGSPLKLGGTPVVAAKAPPLLGEHSAEILGGLLGYDVAMIARAAGQI